MLGESLIDFANSERSGNLGNTAKNHRTGVLYDPSTAVCGCVRPIRFWPRRQPLARIAFDSVGTTTNRILLIIGMDRTVYDIKMPDHICLIFRAARLTEFKKEPESSMCRCEISITRRVVEYVKLILHTVRLRLFRSVPWWVSHLLHTKKCDFRV